MKRLSLTLLLALIASPAVAAGSTASSAGLLTWALLGFFGLIIVSQLVPALITLSAMVKGALGKPAAHKK